MSQLNPTVVSIELPPLDGDDADTAVPDVDTDWIETDTSNTSPDEAGFADDLALDPQSLGMDVDNWDAVDEDGEALEDDSFDLSHSVEAWEDTSIGEDELTHDLWDDQIEEESEAAGLSDDGEEGISEGEEWDLDDLPPLENIQDDEGADLSAEASG